MKKTFQIHIMEIFMLISVHSPFSPDNNEVFKLLGGKFDRPNERWLLPKNDDSRSKLEELFGAESRNVIARVTQKNLTSAGKQLQLGGHVVAEWDDRWNRVSLANAGVELMAGGWDDAASAAHQTPFLSGPDAVFHIVVKSDFANRRGLTVVEELPDEIVENPLRPYADSDLQTELENRGYIVTRAPRRQY